MSPDDPPGPTGDSELRELLESVLPELSALADRFSLPPETVDEVVDDSVRWLLYRWPRIRDRRGWLLDTVERLLDLEARGGRPPPRPAPAPLEEEGDEEAEGPDGAERASDSPGRKDAPRGSEEGDDSG